MSVTESTPASVFLELVSQIERTSSALPPDVSNPASEARVAFERLITKLDNLESDFDRLAERAGKHNLQRARHNLTAHHSFVCVAHLPV